MDVLLLNERPARDSPHDWNVRKSKTLSDHLIDIISHPILIFTILSTYVHPHARQTWNTIAAKKRDKEQKQTCPADDQEHQLDMLHQLDLLLDLQSDILSHQLDLLHHQLDIQYLQLDILQ